MGVFNSKDYNRAGQDWIRGGGRKFMCDNVLTIDSFGLCEDNRTVAVSCTLATAAKSC
jgi:hypothetical protein